MHRGRPAVLLAAILMVCALTASSPVGGRARKDARSLDARSRTAARLAPDSARPAPSPPPARPEPPRPPDSDWRHPAERGDPGRSDVVVPARRPRAAAPTAPSLPLRRSTGTAAIALTFDDGPDPVTTPLVLAQLRAYGIKATFCLVGTRVRAHPELVRQIVGEGHTLCNHTMRHDLRLRTKARARIVADLAQTNELIRQASGVTPKHFRVPGGNWSARVVSAAAELGMDSLHWAVDPQDWRRPPAAQIVSSVKSHIAPGSIVLLHDAGGERIQTQLALRTLLPYLHKRFTLVAL